MDSPGMDKLAGGILMALGILIGGAGGLCTLAATFLGGATSIAIVGLLPIAIGVLMFLGGRAVVRRADRKMRSEDDV